MLAADPRDAEALDGRGVALDLPGRHAEAQESCRRTRGIAQDSVSIATNLGPSLLLDGRPEEARAVLEPVTRRPDAPARVAANYTIFLAATGDEAAARAVLNDPEADLAGLAAALRGNRQVIEVRPANRRC